MKTFLSFRFGKGAAGLLLAGFFFMGFQQEADAQHVKCRVELKGADTIYIEQCRTYTDPGVDRYDTGSLGGKTTSGTLIVSSSPTFTGTSSPQTYTFTYNYTVSGDTADPVNRWLIVVQDTTPPSIQLKGNSTVSVGQCNTWNDSGATAIDSCDGNLNWKIKSWSIPNFNNKMPGTYRFKYCVWDTLGNMSDTLTRYVTVLDTTAPTIQLLGDDTVYVEQCRAWTDPGATASDYCFTYGPPNNLTLQINVTTSPTFDNMVAGTYVRRYRVLDSIGLADTQYRYIIVMADTTAPELIVQGPEYDTIPVGDPFWTMPSAVYAVDCVDGDVLSDVTVSNNVNVNVAGNYTITYSVTDASNNTTVVKRYLTVLDTVFDISGSVVAGTSSGTGRAAKVYLIQYDAVDTTLTALDTFSFGLSQGPNFHFDNLAPGDYLVKAALDTLDSLYANYIPTYYDAETMWDDAQTITLTNANVSNIVIDMVAGTNPGGPGFIGGKVSQGANKKEGDPIEGQLILLTTKDDKPVAYTYSDIDGNYEFNNLALGEYKILGEAEGKKSIAAIVTLDAANTSSRNVDLIVKSTEILAVVYHVKCSAGFTVSSKGMNFTFQGDTVLNKNLMYRWDFGDATVGFGARISHNFNKEGIYNVCLAVNDTLKNCGDDSCIVIKVRRPILEISGLISAEGVTNSTATVWLMKYNAGNNGYDIAETQQVYLDDSESAYYLFDNAAEGQYLVKAALGKASPVFREFMPTYHLSALKWKNADVITLNYDAKYDADIQMMQVPKIAGKGSVRGSIRVGTLKKEGDPVHDVAVLLLDETGNPVSFDLSGADGSYSISNIPNGKYEVYAEIAGMLTYSRWVEITDQDFEFSDINFSVHSDNTITSVKDIPGSVKGMALFPNPAQNELNLQLHILKPQTFSVTVIDMSGKTVLSQSQTLSSGIRNIHLDLSPLRDGIYTVNVIDASGKTVHSKFVKQ